MSAGAVSIPYRADIDGLRALCVVSVILFHAGVPGFPGGYVGVDVFFVVSGYLITLLLVEPSGATLASRMVDFYLRRGRRILPALLVVLILSAITAATLFLPPDLGRFGRSLIYAAALLGNIGAWVGGGYFDLGGPFAPLQHLWSIGVEEQFYLAYPFVLLFAGRYVGRFRNSLVVAVTALSLGLCLWASYRHPDANYYLLPTRAWQLLCGALVALGVVRTVRHRGANEAVATLSLGVLASTVFLLQPTTRYPGVYAIAPTVAATLLIATAITQRTVVSHLLSFPPLVFTGLISYSLYLWHAPILAFFTYYSIEKPEPVVLVGLLATIYLLAVVTWRFVERPVRARSLLRSNRSFAMLSLAATFTLFVVAGVFWSSDGLPQRFATSEIATLTEGAEDFPVVDPSCLNLRTDLIEAGSLCSFGPAAPHVAKVVVWGDSHAYSLLPAYESLANTHRVRLFYGTMGGCRPLVVDITGGDGSTAPCAQFNAAMVQAIQRLDPALVILNAYWLDRDTNVPGVDPAPVTDEPEFLPSLERTLSRIGSGGHSICAVLTVPTNKYPVPYALAMAYRRGISDAFMAVSSTEAHEQYGNVERDMRRLERQGKLRIVDPKEVLCPADQCLLRGPDGTPLYRDRHHLSLSGAEFVSGIVGTCFAEAVL